MFMSEGQCIGLWYKDAAANLCLRKRELRSVQSFQRLALAAMQGCMAHTICVSYTYMHCSIAHWLVAAVLKCCLCNTALKVSSESVGRNVIISAGVQILL
jgi:hypothetical protein